MGELAAVLIVIIVLFGVERFRLWKPRGKS